jgi:predicted pyridoxine 5'-phosphate oxidase superfamily flavin-nucleotide-binding protein
MKATMAFRFGSVIFTSAIKALQEKYGSRRSYGKRETTGLAGPPIGPMEAEFIGERDNFYMATVGEGGWPYVQHRGGRRGFLKVIDDHTIAFADLRGNKQYITAGNLMGDDRVALILVDYPRQARLKILGHSQILEGQDATAFIEQSGTEKPGIARPGDEGLDGVMERVFVIRVEAADWNCTQHITPRFSEEEIRQALAPWEERLAALQQENDELRGRLQLHPAER